MTFERNHDVMKLKRGDVTCFVDIITIERLKCMDVVKILQ